MTSTVLAVTKTFGLDAVLAAQRAGLRAIGENYAPGGGRQARRRRAPMARSPPTVHFIGQLQTNKVRRLVGLVDVVETVDRPSLVDEIAKRMPGQRVLVQVDTADEPGKGGCALAERGRRSSSDAAGRVSSSTV